MPKTDKDKIKEVFTRLKEIKRDEKTKNEVKSLARKKHVLIEDLYKKQCKFADDAIPYCNAYAYDVLQDYFGDISNIQTEDFKQVGVMLYILDNQFNEKLSDMTHADLLREGQVYLMNIPLDKILVYVELILQLFEEIKKKLSRKTLEKLAQAKEIENQILALENSALDSQSASEKT
ncbi:MAG: hypothetical protein H8E22_01765 [Candidatus Cloacimonetes bacterium]|nr:hypothetical protein [Candidatus Cloacimonadota bacterium]